MKFSCFICNSTMISGNSFTYCPVCDGIKTRRLTEEQQRDLLDMTLQAVQINRVLDGELPDE